MFRASSTPSNTDDLPNTPRKLYTPIDPMRFFIESHVSSTYSLLEFISAKDKPILPQDGPLGYVLQTSNTNPIPAVCGAPVGLSPFEGFGNRFPEYRYLLSQPHLRYPKAYVTHILPCSGSQGNSLGFLSRYPEASLSAITRVTGLHPPSPSNPSDENTCLNVDDSFNNNNNNNNGNPHEQDNANTQSSAKESCVFYFYPTHVIQPETVIHCLIRLPELPPAMKSNLGIQFAYLNDGNPPQEDSSLGYIKLDPFDPGEIQIDFNYTVGETKVDENNQQIAPRIDHLELIISNYAGAIDSIFDFSIAMDHAKQRRIDRIFFWDADLAEVIARYWRTSNDPGSATVNCVDSETGTHSVTGRIVINDEDTAPFSVALPQRLNHEATVRPIKCRIPIPIHAVHDRLTKVNYLDIGTWQDQPFGIYLRLKSPQRLFRYHPSTPGAKWNFLNPILSPFASLTQQQTYNQRTSEISLIYQFTISGPYPTIYVNDIFSTDPAFVPRLFASVADDGFLANFYYITNPPDSRTPAKHHTITPTAMKSPLEISNYNGFLQINLHFTIKRREMVPFYVQFIANAAPHYAHFLPALRSTYTFASQSDSTIVIDYTTAFSDRWMENLMLEPQDVPEYEYLPTSLNFQPRFSPFELTPETPLNIHPHCTWLVVDASGAEITPPKAPTISITPNPILSALFSPTRAAPIKISDLLLPYQHTFHLRCAFALKASNNFNKPLPNDPASLHAAQLSLYQPFLYSLYFPPVRITPQPDLDIVTDTDTARHLPPRSSVQPSSTTSPLPLTTPSTQPDGQHWTSGEFGTIISFLVFANDPHPPNSLTFSVLLGSVAGAIRTAQFYPPENPSNPEPSLLPWVKAEDLRLSLVSPSSMTTSFRSPSYPTSSWSRFIMKTDLSHDPTTLAQHLAAPVFMVDVLLPTTLTAQECKDFDAKLRLHLFNEKIFNFVNTDYFGIVASSLALPTYLSVINALLPPFQLAVTNHMNSTVLLNTNSTSPHHSQSLSARDEKLLFPTKLHSIPHSHQLLSQSSSSSSSPTPLSSSPSLDYIHAPLPGFSKCFVDGNCGPTLYCIKGHCAEPWDIDIFSPSEAYVASLFSQITDPQVYSHINSAGIMSLSGQGLPSDFSINFAPSRTHKDSSHVSPVWWFALVAVLLLIGLGIWRFFSYRYKMNKTQSHDEVLLDEIDDDDDEDDDDEDDDEDDDSV